MLLAIFFAIALVVASVLITYETLRLTSDIIPLMNINPQQRIIVVLAGSMMAHVGVIGLFAFSYYLMSAHLGVGSLRGEFQGAPLDFFYYSATTYTTLGVGDVYAHGPMRLVAAIESLIGLVLIAWSASYTYLQMERFWVVHRK